MILHDHPLHSLLSVYQRVWYTAPVPFHNKETISNLATYGFIHDYCTCALKTSSHWTMCWMVVDVTDALQCIKWSAKLANEGTEKWVFDKNVTTMLCSVDPQHITAASESHITEYEEQESTYRFHEAKSLWALTWRGHDKHLLWCWTLSVLVVQSEATVRSVLRGGV